MLLPGRILHNSIFLGLFVVERFAVKWESALRQRHVRRKGWDTRFALAALGLDVLIHGVY